MSTVTNITLVLQRPEREQPVLPIWQRVDSLLTFWEQHYSQTHPLSEVRKLNHRTAAEVTTTPILAEMVRTGLAWGDTLDGRFDITILPVKDVWGLGEEHTRTEPPPDDSLASALARVDYRRVSVVGNRVVFADTATSVDVGGIAKGFVLRELADLLYREELDDFLIVAGGDVFLQGTHPRGNGWRIGVQHPRQRGKLLATIGLTGGCVVTSGDYERFFTHDGVRYHHIFDPATGQSCRENQSVTIYGPDPVSVDILSTGLFGAPAERILAFVQARPAYECIVVDSTGRVHVSRSWASTVSLSKTP